MILQMSTSQVTRIAGMKHCTHRGVVLAHPSHICFVPSLALLFYSHVLLPDMILYVFVSCVECKVCDGSNHALVISTVSSELSGAQHRAGAQGLCASCDWKGFRFTIQVTASPESAITCSVTLNKSPHLSRPGSSFVKPGNH
jgi:hypothetical protein